jgi:hypothetical protein
MMTTTIKMMTVMIMIMMVMVMMMKDRNMLDMYSIVPTIVPYTSCFQDIE